MTPSTFRHIWHIFSFAFSIFKNEKDTDPASGRPLILLIADCKQPSRTDKCFSSQRIFCRRALLRRPKVSAGAHLPRCRGVRRCDTPPPTRSTHFWGWWLLFDMYRCSTCANIDVYLKMRAKSRRSAQRRPGPRGCLPEPYSVYFAASAYKGGCVVKRRKGMPEAAASVALWLANQRCPAGARGICKALGRVHSHVARFDRINCTAGKIYLRTVICICVRVQ